MTNETKPLDPRKCPRYTPTQNSWRGMKDRCLNPNHKWHWKYKDFHYPPWDSYTTFLKDMGERPVGTTLDRIDNSKGYGPDNCRWATHKEQQRNRGNHRLNEKLAQEILAMWSTKQSTVKQVCEHFGLYNSLVSSVLYSGAWQ